LVQSLFLISKNCNQFARFDSGDYEEYCLLGCDAVWLLEKPTFQGEHFASIIRVTKIGELGTTLAEASN
jgi:hypothetical protein